MTTCHASVVVRSLSLPSVSRGCQSLTVPPGNLSPGPCHSPSAENHRRATVTDVAPVINKMVVDVAHVKYSIKRYAITDDNVICLSRLR